jgi:hypothetical protein
MTHVPLIVHNLGLFPEPRETEAFYDHLQKLRTGQQKPVFSLTNARRLVSEDQDIPAVIDCPAAIPSIKCKPSQS